MLFLTHTALLYNTCLLTFRSNLKYQKCNKLLRFWELLVVKTSVYFCSPSFLLTGRIASVCSKVAQRTSPPDTLWKLQGISCQFCSYEAASVLLPSQRYSVPTAALSTYRCTQLWGEFFTRPDKRHHPRTVPAWRLLRWHSF